MTGIRGTVCTWYVCTAIGVAANYTKLTRQISLGGAAATAARRRVSRRLCWHSQPSVWKCDPGKQAWWLLNIFVLLRVHVSNGKAKGKIRLG